MFFIKNQKKNHKRKTSNSYFNNEIFSSVCLILNQCRYTTKLKYFIFKNNYRYSYFTGLKTKCLFNLKNYSNYNKNLKYSQMTFLSHLNNGNLNGFYNALW